MRTTRLCCYCDYECNKKHMMNYNQCSQSSCSGNTKCQCAQGSSLKCGCGHSNEQCQSNQVQQCNCCSKDSNYSYNCDSEDFGHSECYEQYW